MAKWEYRLALKDLLDPDADDTDAHSEKIGPAMIARIESFRTRVETKDEYLSESLEEVVDRLKEIPASLDKTRKLDEAMEVLYTICDYHRVWVQ